MSHIFDALQKSESELPGNDASDLSEVTEVLQRAEHRATSKWTDAAQLGEQGGFSEATCSGSVENGAEQVASMTLEALIKSKTPPTNYRNNVFDEFQSVSVSLFPESKLVCFTASDSPAAEGFRLLGVRLKHLRRNTMLRKVLITSTIPQEGKSLVAANLACTLAQGNQQKVLLLEGDLRRPMITQTCGIGKSLGLCEFLQEQYALTKCIYYLEGPKFWVLPAGEMLRNNQKPLESESLPVLIDQLTVWFDWIIIDSPPVLPLADTSVWMRMADGILLVTRQGATQQRQLQKGLDAIETSKLIGAVYNCSKASSDSYYYYYRNPKTSLPNDKKAMSQ
jgi:capsular exopolysaccharide synthesis family protein